MGLTVKTSPLSATQILKLDREHVWHPYSRYPNDVPVFPVASAEGVWLTLSNGEKLYDGMSSWWSTVHGYNHPKLNQALSQQMERMSHVMFGGLTHEPAVTLAEKLVETSPQGLERVFICDSGSVSVEVALKMALQYWNSRRQNRQKFLTVRNGYHGDTFAAMSVCDPDTGMHSLYADFVHQNYFAPAPQTRFDATFHDDDIRPLKTLAEKHAGEIAAIIIEPIVQGTGGMRFYSPEYLKQLRDICNELDILLIADEIATGFGRAGKFFACEYANISPDILCLGKALTGGYMSLAATLCTEHVALTICEGEAGVFMHGPTFMANPLACSVANASLDLLHENDWKRQVTNIESWLSEGLAPISEISGVRDVRVLGAIGVVELEKPVEMPLLQPLIVSHGIWLRPFGKLLYTMPPFISSQENIGFLTDQMKNVLETYLKDN